MQMFCVLCGSRHSFSKRCDLERLVWVQHLLREVYEQEQQREREEACDSSTVTETAMGEVNG